jgi:hypothetical protein
MGCNRALLISGLKACFLRTLSVSSRQARPCAAADESFLTMCWSNGLMFSVHGLPQGFDDDVDNGFFHGAVHD